MNKPKIIVIENAPAITGGLTSSLRESALLAPHYDFVFILPKKSAAIDYVKKFGFSVLEFPLKEIRKSVLSLLTYIPVLLYNGLKLRRLEKKLSADLIIVNDIYNLIPVFYKLFGGRRSYICCIRFLPSKFPAPLVYVWCVLHRKFAVTSIAVSNAVRNELPYKENVKMIYHSLPQERVDLTISKSCILLYPANYIKGKGQEYAIEMFARIHRKFPDWSLRFVGGDLGLQKNLKFKNHLERKVVKLGIQNQVEFLDFSNELQSHYLDASFILNFSESESFSLTCLEALYHGRPVIATKCGGPQEIIDHDVNGLLVDRGDVEGMANAVMYLITHPAEREAMGKMAYTTVREKFTYEKTVGKLNEVYKSALTT